MTITNHNKHPKELIVLSLCGIAMRFSFWGVGNLLVIYLLEYYNFSSEKATHIYGIFTGLSAFLPLLGGYISDKWNYHQPLFFAAILAAIGCFLIAIGIPILLYIALGLLCLGFGIFVPSVFAILSYTYRNKRHLREAGFSLYYSSFNIGVFLALISMGYISKAFGWSTAFVFAGFIQVLGIIPTIWYYKKFHLTYKDLHPRDKEVDPKQYKSTIKPHEKDRILVIIFLSLISIFFWSAYNQGWSSMSIFALKYTNKTFFGFQIPTAWILSVESLFLIIIAPILAKTYTHLQSKHKDLTPITKTVLSLIFIGFCFFVLAMASLSIPANASSGNVSPFYMVLAYFLMAIGEMLIGPVGISLVTQLSPHKYIGLLVGLWYVTSGIGYYIAGLFAGHITSMKYIHNFFSLFIFWTIIPAIILFFFKKKINKLRHLDRL